MSSAATTLNGLANLDSLFSVDELVIRASVRGLTKRLGALSVLGIHLEDYGCAGITATEYGLACLQLEATDSGIRSLVSVQGSLAMFAIWKWGEGAR